MRVCRVWFVPFSELLVSSPRVAAATGGIFHIPGTFHIPSAGGKNKGRMFSLLLDHLYSCISCLISVCLCTRMVLMEALKVNMDLSVSWASSNWCSSCSLCSLAASSLFFSSSKCWSTEVLHEKKNIHYR